MNSQSSGKEEGIYYRLRRKGGIGIILSQL